MGKRVKKEGFLYSFINCNEKISAYSQSRSKKGNPYISPRRYAYRSSKGLEIIVIVVREIRKIRMGHGNLDLMGIFMGKIANLYLVFSIAMI
ncbi:hypothetical protein DRJ16_07450 [Candidatus Woesearchaeota archaeon]|nr:MAG: hypothetical protein DRJ16_07450 [Candidatus Woesearchaeota archaeon]